MGLRDWFRSQSASEPPGNENLSFCIQGWSEFELGNYREALKLFEKGIKTGNLGDAYLARTYRNMGLASHGCGQLVDAVKYYDEAIALSPADPWDDYVNKGNALSELGEFENALQEYEKAFAVRPNYNEAYFNRGVVFEKQDKIDEAINEYKQAYHFGLRSQLLYERLVAHGIIEKGPTPMEDDSSVPPTESWEGEPNLPHPPDGFSWQRFPEVRVALLRPTGWYVHSVAEGSSFTACISTECIKSDGVFETGLTMQVVRGVQQSAGAPASATAIGIYQSIANDGCNEVLFADEELMETSDSVSFRFRFRNAPPMAKPIIVHKFFIAFDRISDLYMFTFESPESMWDQSWEKGNQIMSALSLTP